MDTPPAHLNPAEVRRRLRRLRAAEAVRLAQLARVFARRVGPWTEGTEMLNEAIARVLEGRRSWPADVPLDAFFAQVMRSIAHEWRERAVREPSLADHELADVGVAPSHLAELESVTAAARRALAGDPLALRLFEIELEEVPVADIKRALNLDDTAYDTLRRRRRRCLLAAFPDGCPL